MEMQMLGLVKILLCVAMVQYGVSGVTGHSDITVLTNQVDSLPSASVELLHGVRRRTDSPSPSDPLGGPMSRVRGRLENGAGRTERPEPAIDPEGSWINFVRRSRSKSHRSRRRDQKRVAGETGRDNSGLSKRKQPSEIQELREIIREEVARNIRQCPECSHNVSLRPLPRVDVALLPRISAAFTIKLKHNAPIKQQAMMELRTYYLPYTQGSPQRGTNLNGKYGRYVAPVSGMYHVTATLHVAHDGYKQRRPRKLRRTEKLEATICIDSQCKKYSSINFISGLESNSRTFTISLNGILEVKAGQYVSVFVNNQSHRQVTVLKESSFTGLLLGG